MNMNDQEIRMWAVQQVQQVMNEYRDADAAMEDAEKLYLFVTGKRVPIVDEYLK